MITNRSVCLFLFALFSLLPLRVAHAAGTQHEEHQRDHESQHGEHDREQSRLHHLEAEIKQLQTQLSAVQAQLAQGASVFAIAPYVSLETINDHPTVRFSGANVQVVNGMGSTTTANALGNLIIGYDEPEVSGPFRCTIGMNPSGATPTPVTDATTCAAAGGEWVNTGFKTGSHFLVLGTRNSYSRWGGLVAGVYSVSNYDFAGVTGGFRNTASGLLSTVTGGINNTASNVYGSVSGGNTNAASGIGSTISGGYANTASGYYSSVSGGALNTASYTTSSVTGGASNTASGIASAVCGGRGNTASDSYSVVCTSGDASALTQTIPAEPVLPSLP